MIVPGKTFLSNLIFSTKEKKKVIRLSEEENEITNLDCEMILLDLFHE